MRAAEESSPDEVGAAIGKSRERELRDDGVVLVARPEKGLEAAGGTGGHSLADRVKELLLGPAVSSVGPAGKRVVPSFALPKVKRVKTAGDNAVMAFGALLQRG